MKREPNKILVAAAALAALVGCQSTGGSGAKPQNATDMSGGVRQTAADLESYYAEPHRTRWKNAAGLTGVSEIAPDGVIKVDWGKGGDVGRWEIESDAFCTTYQQIRKGEKRCAFIYAFPNGERRSFDAETGRYISTSWPRDAA